ncbi:MAG: AAA family ATPase [Polyangiaceae bacterium]|nr:AAA family ATPase [Polyangiaceae bacterium]
MVARHAEELRRAVEDASRGLVQRESLVELVVLCAVAREHLLVIGPPGTAKSEAVRRIARRLGGGYFEYLVGRFTEPTEIFGPINLQKLKQGVVEAETRGMLPEADIAFLDEVFLGSTAILNTLLAILNERRFRRGHTDLHCPLRVCVGAANSLPEETQLAAFADRFLVRQFVEPVGDTSLEALLEAGWSLGAAAPKPAPKQALEALDGLSKAALALDLAPVRADMAHAVRLLRRAGIEWTDRRIVRSQRLVAASAVLAGRAEVSRADLWPLIFALPTAEAQAAGREVLAELLSESQNTSLLSAALESSLGARARAGRLLRDGRALLDDRQAAADRGAWRLAVENLARDIDASFGSQNLEPELQALREEVVKVLGEQQATDAADDVTGAPGGAG